jgi:hypothetical protein
MPPTQINLLFRSLHSTSHKKGLISTHTSATDLHYLYVWSAHYLKCNQIFCLCDFYDRVDMVLFTLKESHIEIIAHTIPNILTVCLINCNSDI